MANGEQQQQVPQDQFLAELEALFAGGSSLPQESVLGGFWGGDPATLGGPAGIPYAPGQAPEVYYEGDEASVLRNMTTEELARFQDALVATGLVREVIPGRLDDNTLSGMGTLMSVANRQAVEWGDVLDGIVAAGGLSGAASQQAQEFEPQPYMRPDYATIAQRVKDTFRTELGRDPDEYEMRELTAELTGFDMLAHEREQELSRLAFDQQQQPGVQGGGTVQGVDPLSRFRQMFEQRYSEELDFVEDKERAQDTEGIMQGAAQMISQASRSSF